MLVTLIGKNSINKVILPKIIEGSYWINDNSTGTEAKLINIEAKNNSWQINSNNNVHIIPPEYVAYKGNTFILQNRNIQMISKATLQEYSKFWITFGKSKEVFLLYCLPVFSSKFFRLDINGKTEFTVGRNSKNDVFYKNELIANFHARFAFYNGAWMVEPLEAKFGTFVNNKPISNNATALSNGDIVFIMGLKILIMGKSVFINNPQEQVFFNNKIFTIHNDKIEIIPDDETASSEDISEDQKYFLRTPRIRKKIETATIKIDEPPAVQNKDEIPAIISMGSSLTMGVVMLITVMRSVDGLASGTTTLKEAMFSLASAVAMLVSAVLFPILSKRYNKKQKKKYEEKRQTRYQSYLNSKNQALHKIMEEQKNILLENYPSIEECIQIIVEKNHRLWERKIDDYDFLHIRVGTRRYSIRY